MLLGTFTTANVTTNRPNTSDLLADVLGDCGLSGEQPTIASERIKGRRNFMHKIIDDVIHCPALFLVSSAFNPWLKNHRPLRVHLATLLTR
jgi:hypothetical protein